MKRFNFFSELKRAGACLAIFPLVLSELANGQCPELIKPHVSYLISHPDNKDIRYFVNMVFVANTGPQITLYGNAKLHLNAGKDSLVGEVTIIKTAKLVDQRVSLSNFYPVETKAIAIQIITGVVRIDKSFINAPQCSNLLLYGFGSTSSFVPFYYTISFLDKYELK